MQEPSSGLMKLFRRARYRKRRICHCELCIVLLTDDCSGLMIHYVIAEVDMGEAIVTRDVELKRDETLEQLEERFHTIEHGAIIEGTKLALARLSG